MSDFDRDIAATAAKQHQVITFGDVESCGGNYKHVEARIRAGRWQFFRDNVYRLAGVPWTYEATVFATVCAAGKGAVASHFCAARLHGLGFPTAFAEVSVPRGRFHRPENITVHTSTDLDRCEIVTLHGCIPVTDPGRTMLDVARKLGPVKLKKAIANGRRAELLDWHDLVRTLVRHARRGRPGVTKLREAIALGYTENEATDTDSEEMAYSLLVQHGFPEPVVHHRIHEPDGRIAAEIDLAYPGKRIGFEIDGPVHQDPVVMMKDHERDDYLRAQFDWRIRRIWWEIPMKEPARFVRIVRETLR